MLEYRAIELTQAKLDVLASQHNPQSLLSKGMGRDKFEAPDLLLPSMHKPAQETAASVTLTTEDGEDEDLAGGQDYGEEYDDTRTFTVKDFKEQALRYAKDHFGSTSQHHTHMQNQASSSDINNSHMGSNPFTKQQH
jgi:hypothetical protein